MMETETGTNSTLTYEMGGTNLPWKVTMARKEELRSQKVQWCRSNVVGDGRRGIMWAPPRPLKDGEKADWWNMTQNETWSFRAQEDAVMFRMVWGF